MKTVGFIFARKGSKGFPNKNIHILEGKPLIAWAIEDALAVKQIERVIVSTDSEEIAAIAREYGAETPFIRPKELAQDNSPEWLAWQHALKYVQETSGSLPEIMVSIPTTAPMRLPCDIENCIKEYEKGDVDVIVTVTESHRNPYFNMVKTKPDGTIGLVIPPPLDIFRRQDAPTVYDMATVCFVANSKFVMTHNELFEGRVRAVHIPKERSIDIDTFLDFQVTEYLQKKKLEKQ